MKLYLNITDVLDESRADKMLNEIVLPPLNVDLHQVNSIYMILSDEINRPNEGYLRMILTLLVNRRGISSKCDFDPLGFVGQAKSVNKNLLIS